MSSELMQLKEMLYEQSEALEEKGQQEGNMLAKGSCYERAIIYRDIALMIARIKLKNNEPI